MRYCPQGTVADRFNSLYRLDEENLLLDVRRQKQQVHHLGHSCARQ
jgi:hypothetical protein